MQQRIDTISFSSHEALCFTRFIFQIKLTDVFCNRLSLWLFQLPFQSLLWLPFHLFHLKAPRKRLKLVECRTQSSITMTFHSLQFNFLDLWISENCLKHLSNQTRVNIRRFQQEMQTFEKFLI